MKQHSKMAFSWCCRRSKRWYLPYQFFLTIKSRICQNTWQQEAKLSVDVSNIRSLCANLLCYLKQQESIDHPMPGANLLCWVWSPTPWYNPHSQSRLSQKLPNCAFSRHRRLWQVDVSPTDEDHPWWRIHWWRACGYQTWCLQVTTDAKPPTQME